LAAAELLGPVSGLSSPVVSWALRSLVVLVLAGEHGERSEPRAAGRGRRPP
jgi:hypothetical protein